jgi:hypothetical protein
MLASSSSPGTKASGAIDAAGSSHLQAGRPSLGSRSADDGPDNFGSSASGHSEADKSSFVHGTRV